MPKKQYFLELEEELNIFILDYKILEKKIAEFYGYDSYDYKYYTEDGQKIMFFDPPVEWDSETGMIKIPLDESEQWVIDQVKLKNNQLEFYPLETLIKNMYLEGAIDMEKGFMVEIENDEE